MGMAPIGWDTIGWWQQTMGVELAPWEARMLRFLSRDYLIESQAAEKPDAPAPWMETVDREAIADKVVGIFGRMIGQGRNAGRD